VIIRILLAFDDLWMLDKCDMIECMMEALRQCDAKDCAALFPMSAHAEEMNPQ
jgi:hypothetical protein